MKFKGLIKLKGKTKNFKLFGFDTETYRKNKKFLCASLVGEDYSKFFTDREEMLKELTSNQIFRNSMIYATNLMFDFGVLFPDLENIFNNFEIIERNGSLVYCRTYVKYDKDDYNFYHKGDTYKKSKEFYPIIFCDTLNHIKASVKQLGTIINLPKLDSPKRLGFKPKNKTEWEYMKIYNIRDSEISYKFMKFLQQEYNKLNCNLKVTISSTAMDLFRRRYLNIFIRQEEREKILLQYKAYYGGRTEAFKRGLFTEENYGRIKVYDVNSLYPFCLKENNFPVPESQHFEKISSNFIDSFEGIAYVEMKSPKDMNIPLVPMKTDKLIFPLGTIKGYYDFNTIRKALNNGYNLLDCGEGLVYENKFSPFKNMVNELYKMKIEFKKRKDNTDLVPKILSNSFYGKFGFNFANKEKIVHADKLHLLPEFETASIYPYSKNLYRVVTDENDYIPSYVFPIISLYVTSYARSYMFDMIKKTGFDRVLYTDTDSIFSTRKIDTSDNIGDLKLEKTFNEVCIIKPKFYSGITEKDEVIRVKGINGRMSNHAEIMKMVKNNNFKVNTTHFAKLRTALKGKKYINEVYDMIKDMALDDDKRFWEKPKFTLTPQNSKPLTI